MYRLLLALTLTTLTGCAPRYSETCRRWQAQGDFYASLDACSRCIETMGEAGKDAIAGCALGYDATRLLSPSR